MEVEFPSSSLSNSVSPVPAPKSKKLQVFTASVHDQKLTVQAEYVLADIMTH